MNDMADRVCDKHLNIWEDGVEIPNKESPQNVEFCPFGLRFRLFVDGKEIGKSGTKMRWSRGQGANIFRSTRLDDNLRWLVVMSVDGQEMPGEHTEENINKFLCQERTEGVYDLCQYCGRDEGI